METNWKTFYKQVFMLVLPMAIQNLINVGVTAADVMMLGRVGEDKAFEIEQQRLAAVNATLSKLVIPCYKLHATHGYDIISYHDDGTPVFIEVKTTNKTNPGEFQLTKYETETATKLTEAGYEYWIYVFSNGIDGNMQLEKVPFKRLLNERRIEPVRYQCNIRPHPETKTESFTSDGRWVSPRLKPPILWIFRPPVCALMKTAISSAP